MFVFKILSVALLACYPFLVYFTLDKWGLAATAPLLLVVFALRLATTFTARQRNFFFLGLAAAAAGVLLTALSWLLKRFEILLYYPVATNLLFLFAFAATLARPPSIIERLARLTRPDFPPEGVSYTTKVTKIWCAFFLFNTAFSLGTVFSGDVRFWTIYNGAVSYLLMALLFVGEYLVRRKILSKDAPG
ncbi:MAG: hypothetical protein LBD14_01010 [Puniceicoccales bacterium]|nr:hypothetical protein [Puniceicoccales bacterium]